jgi:Heterokaryon incompatibility protein (HET)
MDMDDLTGRLRSNFRFSNSHQRHTNDPRIPHPRVRQRRQTGIFCRLCEQGIRRRPPPAGAPDDLYQIWEQSFRELELAAGIGCTICTEVYSYILDPLPLINPLEDDLLHLSSERRNRLHIICYLIWDGFSYYQMQFTFYESEARRRCVGYQLYRLLPIESVKRFEIPDPMLRRYDRNCTCCSSSFDRILDGFGDYMSLINFWMDTCIEGHSKCGTDNSRFLPNRVIDVGFRNVASQPRLITRRDPAWRAGEPYVTLSHRWKATNMPTLSTSNIAMFKTAIPMRDLPKTFREAIHVTRELGIRFLWIDALAIIQDSEDDWKHESALMGKIYESGYLNISAVETDPNSGGLFHSIEGSDRYDVLNLRLESNWNLDYTRGADEYYLIRQSVFYGLADAPLNLRGWVFQERALAPRTLYFGRERIYWECCQSAASSFRSGTSIYNLAWPQDFHKSDGFGRQNPKMWKHVLSKHYEAYKSGEGTLNQLSTYWDANVMNYAATELTKESDKLVALSGLAKSFQNILQDDYLAGLWRRTLMYDLLWRTRDTASTSRPLEYRSPSWSWASLNSAPHGVSTYDIPQFSFECHHVANIINVRVEPVDEDITGQVKSAYLKIRGLLLPYTKADSRRVRSGLSDLRPNLTDMSNSMFSRWEIDFDVFEDSEMRPEQHRYLHLLVRSNAGQSSRDRREFTIRGLILRPAYPGSEEFVRIGVFGVGVRDLPQYHIFFDRLARNERGIHRVVTIL